MLPAEGLWDLKCRGQISRPMANRWPMGHESEIARSMHSLFSVTCSWVEPPLGRLSSARFEYEGPGWGYAVDGDTVTVSVRHRDGEVAVDQAWLGTSAGLLAPAAPWRTFR